MTDFYVKPGDGGTQAGTQANPFVDLQDAIDAVETATGAPHNIYAQGTQILVSGGTAEINMLTVQDGSLADGFNNIIGTNASWVDDGTLFILQGNDSNGQDGINPAVKYWRFKNIEVKEVSGSGLYSAAEYCIFDNVISHDNGLMGFRGNNHCVHHRCSSYNNASNGYEDTGIFIACQAYSNGGDGFTGLDLLCYGCIAHDNTIEGYDITPNYIGGCINCVSDDNTSNNYHLDNARMVVAIGCRSTNSSAYGFLGGTGTTWVYEDHNFSLNNASGVFSGQVISGGNSLTSGTEGYVDAANDDYNLTDSATLRRTAIVIP